jgi:cyanophycinase
MVTAVLSTANYRAVALVVWLGLPMLALGQTFDEKFDHWPTDLKINGTVIAGRELPEEPLRPLLPKDLTAEQVLLIVPPSFNDDSLLELKADLGFTPEDDIATVRETAELKSKLAESLTGKSLCYWLSDSLNNADGANENALSTDWIDAFTPLTAHVEGGGTLIAIGDRCSTVGALFSQPSGETAAGLGLFPDVTLQFSAVDGDLDRGATLSVLGQHPGTVAVEIQPKVLVHLSGRTVRCVGSGRATFVLMATDHLPLRVETIVPQTGRRQSALEYLLDLTEWRRDAIDRTISRFPPLEPEKPFVKNGALVIVGGGGMPAGLMEKFVELAGGVEKAHLVYVPCTEENEVDPDQSLVRLWKKMGVENATVIHTKDRRLANTDEAILGPLREATGVWFGGGRQWNLADSYYGTQAHKLMKEVVLRGGAIGGSSAGASIQARYLARATPIQNFRIMAPGYERGGLGFISGVAIDQHFSQRGRQKDMTTLVDRYPQLLGIGLDEATAIIVQESVAEVVGRGRAHFYDRNLPVYPNRPDFTALPAGSIYNLAERKVLKNAEPKTPGRLVSPEVHPDRTVTFRISAPNANQVEVHGIHGQETLVLSRNTSGVWEGKTPPLPPELYSYTFKVDGATLVDPSNRNVKKWLSCASLVEVPGEDARLYESVSVPHGTVHQHIYDSATTGVQRRVFVYTPPGYKPDRAEGYPTLLLLHGFGDDESAWLEVGRANYIADNLVAQGKLRPTIIIMPYGHPIPVKQRDDFEDYAPRNSEALEKDLISDLLPFLKDRYRLASKRDELAIVGLSMGGGQSLLIGMQNLDRFAYVGGFSSATPQGDADAISQQMSRVNSKETNDRLKLLWIGCGKDDFLFERNNQFVEWLEAQEFNHTYHISEGGHDWIIWRQYLPQFLMACFPVTEKE